MIILKSSYNHLTIILQSAYNHLTIILPSSYNHLTIILQSSYNHLTIILQSSYNRIMIILPSYYDHFIIRSSVNSLHLTLIISCLSFLPQSAAESFDEKTRHQKYLISAYEAKACAIKPLLQSYFRFICNKLV
jgi:hypothetical protein